MTTNSPSGGLVGRLNAALDRLEIALEASEAKIDAADEAAAAFHAMTADRAALAERIDTARARAAALEAAALNADAEVAAAAKAVAEALDLTPGRSVGAEPE
jgi:hypothetical protein